MKFQEKHQYKDTKQLWEYALAKVVNEHQENKNKKKRIKK